MSLLSNDALKSLSAGQLDDARRIAAQAVEQAPGDWHAHYALGQCFRFSRDYPDACKALALANELEPGMPFVLLALSIARQLSGDYEGSIDAVRRAIEIDPDYANAYNTLGMTQKLVGAYDKAAHNYSEGTKALARKIAGSLDNAESSPRFPDRHSRHDLWAEYAVFGALYLASLAGIERVAWPSGDMATEDARTGRFMGWYWQDGLDYQQKTNRLFFPNFFNAFCAKLRADPLYAHLMGNRSTVLRLMRNSEEADKHLQEAEDFLEPG